LVEKENGFISEEILFSGGSVSRGRSLEQAGPLPGQKSIRLAKKGCDSSNFDAGFRHFSQANPWPPRLFAEKKWREQSRLLPTLIVPRNVGLLARAKRMRV
jgi:hypothetical protein